MPAIEMHVLDLMTTLISVSKYTDKW